MKTFYEPSEECILFIKSKENCAEWDEYKKAFLPYPDSGGLSTIGWGHLLTHIDISSGIFEHGLSQHGCDLLFLQDLKPLVNFINNLGFAKTQGQFDALVDLGYNAGRGAVLQVQKNPETAVEIFAHYIHDKTGKTLKGLVERRTQDIAWWLGCSTDSVVLSVAS